MIHIKEGVHLHILPSSKFKTISIRIKFKSTLKEKSITKKALLSNMLEVNSKHYPTQTDFSRKLRQLYGAGFFTDVSRKGNIHILTVGMSIVNDKYLQTSDVFEEAVEFLNTVLFYPNAFDGSFHKATFEKEIENLRDDYISQYDYKSDYTALALNKLYFEELKHGMSTYGRKEDLDKISPNNLFDVYKEMLEQDEIDIYVLGDIEEDRVKEAIEKLQFNARRSVPAALFYKKTLDGTVKRGEETQEINQAKLILGFQAPVYFLQANYFVGQVFDGIFGSYPHSKLFNKVREENSLAYDISSSIDTFRGYMTVNAGVDSNEAKRVEDLILAQLEEMKQGNFSEQILLQTKEMLKNELHQTEDNEDSTIERMYSTQLVNKNDFSIKEWLQKIDEVTKDDIIDLSKRIKLQAVFLLKGETQ